MTSLELVGWRKGLKKVSLAVAIQNHSTTESLKEARRLVGDLMSGQTVVLHFATDAEKARFREIADELGAIPG
jgi:hypothetical protein